MKKALSLLLVLAMTVCLLAGCGGDSGKGSDTTSEQNSAAVTTDYPLDGSWPEETVKIGVLAFDTTDEAFMGVMNYYDYLAEHFNVEFIISESISSAEQEFAFIDSCAAAGCQAIRAYYNIAGAEAIKHATAQGMYYYGIDEYYEEVKDDPYYVGSYTFSDPNDPDAPNGEYLAGYELGYTMGTAGLNHVAFCNGGASFGVQMFIDRQQGFFDGMAKAQEEGSTTQFDPEKDVIEGFPSESYFAAQAAFFTEDYDGIVSSFDAFDWFQPIIESGKDIKVGCIGSVSDTYKSFIDNGTVIALLYDAPEIVHGSGFCNILNAVTGHSDLYQNEDGTALLNQVQRWTVTSADDFNAIYDMHNAGEYYTSAEQMASLLGGLNEDATRDDVIAMFDRSLEDCLN